MILGIVVEGERDKATYPVLIQKIRPDIQEVIAEAPGNDVKLKNSFVGWLKRFQWHTGKTVDKALVIRDSDCADPAPLEEEFRQILVQSRFHPTFPVHFHATKCEVESWLLADIHAINRVATQRGKNRRAQPITIQLEGYRDAKELFRGVMNAVGLPVDPVVYSEIAKAADIGQIATCCPHFREFMTRVRAC